MNMFMFNICLNMNTRTCYIAHTIILLLEYLLNYGIKTRRLITYYLTSSSIVSFFVLLIFMKCMGDYVWDGNCVKCMGDYV
jgi:hypothetical protein